ncbi:MAG TPA: hypothetical protein VGP76_00765 [Planctomycetaceae bacterium]|nr:hypothetical protein [Planctomycetaceae bacterium]
MSGLACLWIVFIVCMLVAIVDVDWPRFRKRTLVIAAAVLAISALLLFVAFVAFVDWVAPFVR